MGNLIKFQVESGLAEISMVAVSVKALCVHFKLSELMGYQIALCVDEMMNNITEHNFQFEKGKQIEVCLGFNEENLEIELSYLGPPMPEQDPPILDYDPTDTPNLPERGFGLYLIHQIMDELKCNHENGLTTIYMRREIPC